MGVLLRRIAVCSVALLGLWPQLGWTHAFPQHSEPKVGATVAAPPSRVQIWFDGALEPLFSSIRVQDANGRHVDTGDGHVNAADPMLLETSLVPSLLAPTASSGALSHGTDTGPKATSRSPCRGRSEREVEYSVRASHRI
jgi:methionine-rich copper-binding protein CopC